MAEAFEIGDAVRLKGGSQNMTVESVSEDGNVTCSWHLKSGVRTTDVFQAATLERVPPRKPQFAKIVRT